MLSAGGPAPGFVLPGVDGARARVYRLADCLADGPALLAFVDETGVRNAARDLSWFDLIEGVTPLVISGADCATYRSLVGTTSPAAPLLSDPNGAVAAAYGVGVATDTDDDADDRAAPDGGAAESGGAVFLVDPTGEVSARWRVPETLDALDLATVKEATQRYATDSTLTA